MNEVMHRRLSHLFIVLAILLLGACSRSAEEPPLAGARLGGPFTLVDQDGRTVRSADFDGRYRLIYFGYSYCPDICPTDLQVIGQAFRRFEKSAPERARRLQPIFITVDPERDTPAVLKSYVAAFHPRLIGLTGTPAEIDAVRKSFAIYASKQATGHDKDYLVDHSRQAMLFGPKGEPMLLLPQEDGADAIAAALDKWVK
ncbi:MAG TPA: SCO family protein [Allosphingosinicella sp.]|nr:SCO family protein [Allosphingosinicella sp.]